MVAVNNPAACAIVEAQVGLDDVGVLVGEAAQGDDEGAASAGDILAAGLGRGDFAHAVFLIEPGNIGNGSMDGERLDLPGQKSESGGIARDVDIADVSLAQFGVELDALVKERFVSGEVRAAQPVGSENLALQVGERAHGGFLADDGGGAARMAVAARPDDNKVKAVGLVLEGGIRHAFGDVEVAALKEGGFGTAGHTAVNDFDFDVERGECFAEPAFFLGDGNPTVEADFDDAFFGGDIRSECSGFGDGAICGGRGGVRGDAR